MAEDLWYPDLTKIDPKVADALRLLFDGVYALAGKTGTPVVLKNALDLGGNVASGASNSDVPTKDELLTKAYADAAYGPAPIRKALKKDGSHPLPIDPPGDLKFGDPALLKGKRIEIDSTNGFRAYDDGNNLWAWLPLAALGGGVFKINGLRMIDNVGGTFIITGRANFGNDMVIATGDGTALADKSAVNLIHGPNGKIQLVINNTVVFEVNKKGLSIRGTNTYMSDLHRNLDFQALA